MNANAFAGTPLLLAAVISNVVTSIHVDVSDKIFDGLTESLIHQNIVSGRGCGLDVPTRMNVDTKITAVAALQFANAGNLSKISWQIWDCGLHRNI